MFIEANRLNQLNKNIFGHGISQMKKLIPDSARMVMPDPSLPKIKRYNIKSNNPLNYLLIQNQQSAQPPANIPQESQQSPEIQENANQPEDELYSNKEEEIQMQDQPVPAPESEPDEEVVEKKFNITNLGENNILLPPNYGTDDEYEYKLINLINEPKENFQFACENKNAKVYKRKNENDVQLLKTYGTIPYPLSRIRPVLMDTEKMDDWDKTFKKHEVIQRYPEENGVIKEINYMYIKMPVFMTDRDLVQETKIWKEYNGNAQNFLKVYRSTTNSKYPLQDKPIRAEMIIGGMYLKEVGPNETLIYMINNFDLKMTTGKDLADSQAPERAKDYIPNLIKYIEKHG